MQPQALDFASDDARTGFRLHRFELLNWGTFDEHVWHIEPAGDNALVTGDIGSGKSTLVDALTTLLVPGQRIVYNKAAGAESRERTLLSYVRGEYKSEKDDLTQSARSVALRGPNKHTVLLARFHNEGYDQGLTLAQVLWVKDGQSRPERFFVVSETRLEIARDFAGFGTDILKLKQRLRRTDGVDVFDHFKPYATRFRHVFGIAQAQALDLFYQTVSMKSVGNLTDFVRGHMLEQFDAQSRIDELRRNFENLNAAHEAVLKAKRQIGLLEPIVEDGKRYTDSSQSLAHSRRCRDALEHWFAAQVARLLDKRIARFEENQGTLSRRKERNDEALGRARAEELSIRIDIEASGGQRLRELEAGVERLIAERDRKHKAAEQYAALCRKAELDGTLREEIFVRTRKAAETQRQDIEQELEKNQQALVDCSVELKKKRQEHEELEAEIASLRARRSNIPRSMLALRDEMVATLELDAESLPFAGELLQVDEDERDWEGAIERVLHGFGLSMLVPEELYRQVARYVDRTHLRGRLVYFRAREPTVAARPAKADPRSLFRKLHIRTDSPFYAWLEAELARRFDYVCCDELETFRRLPRAVTLKGQIKGSGQRHEKDDRRALGDRSHFVLGWSNASKIETFERRRDSVAVEGQAIAVEIEALRKAGESRTAMRDAVRDLLNFPDFSALDWRGAASEIARLDDERKALEASSDTLRELKAQLERKRVEIDRLDETRTKLTDAMGQLTASLRSAIEDLSAARELAGELSDEERDVCGPRIEQEIAALDEGTALSVHNANARQRAVRERLQASIDADQRRIDNLSERLVERMQNYKRDYPAETTEVDSNLAALPDYAARLGTLRSEDLPRHEQRFKQLLNEGTIQDVALFQNQLDKEKREIERKIGTINQSLRAIEYNPGTYIELVTDPAQDTEVREFQGDLRACLAHSLSEEDELYDEQRFLKVKTLIDRFNGRESLTELDRRWTRKVTDVRNWFNFSAEERWREDDSVREYYSDSAGKSGGQKEKLAYTILASALAYQFGLEWNAIKSRSFRFVMIDEAFGRGSDESTRYALELFKKLNLQLLIVTPLQKIQIIEAYVAAVHFIHNEDGRRSLVRNLTIEQYRQEKRRYLEGAAE